MQHNKLPELLARMALASGVGYLAAAYAISRLLTRPTPYRLKTGPGDYGLEFEKVHCRASDGIQLAGWVTEPSGARATVALFHGMRGNRERVLDRMLFLVRNGYRCVAFDLRAHGESQGKRTSFGYHESRDSLAVLHYVQERWPNQPRAALGISMGAAALCYAGSASRGWDALILESCYQDIARAFASRLQNHYPPWYQRLSRGVIWVTERRLGLRLSQLAPIDHVADLAPRPVFFVTGADDVHAPPAEAQELYARCREPRELWVVPRAGHRDVYEMGGDTYHYRVLDFLARHLAA
jgi:alpha-beta hydrolase superfamily lysophospholipase